MGADADNDDIPEFKKTAVGTLTPGQRDIADTAKEIADRGGSDLVIDPLTGITSGQHCSHGSHGSHGSHQRSGERRVRRSRWHEGSR